MEYYFNSLFVLLVEPSISQRKIILQQFEEPGIEQYQSVDTGQQALDIIDSEHPDLVISAMFLEDMTGRDLVLEMRENPVCRDIPFMLISPKPHLPSSIRSSRPGHRRLWINLSIRFRSSRLSNQHFPRMPEGLNDSFRNEAAGNMGSRGYPVTHRRVHNPDAFL